MVRTKKVYRKHIIDGAYSLVLEEGFKKFQARNIAKRISCSTQPIYREFDNLAEVREALETRVLEKYQHFIEGAACDQLRELSQGIIDYAKENPVEFQRFFIEAPESSETLKAITQGYYQKTQAPDGLYNLFWCYIIGRASLSSNHPNGSADDLELLTEFLNQ